MRQLAGRLRNHDLSDRRLEILKNRSGRASYGFFSRKNCALLEKVLLTVHCAPRRVGAWVTSIQIEVGDN